MSRSVGAIVQEGPRPDQVHSLQPGRLLDRRRCSPEDVPRAATRGATRRDRHLPGEAARSEIHVLRHGWRCPGYILTCGFQ